MDTMSEPKKQEETKPNWWVLCLACAAIVLDGYDTVALDGVNRRAVEFMRTQAERSDVQQVLVSGVVGPRGDGAWDRGV